MELGEVIMLIREGVMQVFILCAPVLGSALIIGLVVAILQATTSIQEQTLTFLPKLIIVLLVIALLGGWMLSTLSDYTKELFAYISRIT